MRKEFVLTKKESEAWESCPWASVVLKAIDGFWCFESVDDAEVWRNQK